MLIDVFMLTPYLAIASSLTLAATIAVVCFSQRPVPQKAGFQARRPGRNA